MKDRVKRKLEETAALQIGRRDRGGVHDRMGLSTRGTHDPFVEAQMVEQPIPTAPPGAPSGEQDVIVQPTTPPGMGGEMQPPEEPVVPEEEPGEEEPEVDVDEEMKRSLFNTLSELIDLGRIGRNEAEIRKYVDDHEDEIGELIDVLDDVVDMLIGEGTVLREPKTFDVGDEEEPPTQAGDFDETKPGVGGQVPQGGTTTTIIASDQSRGNGGALHESIMTKITSGADIDLTLERATEELTEETLEYGFETKDDLSRAMQILDGLDMTTTNVMRVDPTTIHVVRDDRNREDVERQLSAIRDAGIELSFFPKEPAAAAAEGAATPATLVSGPNVGQLSTVQGEGVDEALFADWYVVSKDERGVSAKSFGTDKKAAQAAAVDPSAKVVRAGSEKDAIAKFGRRSDDVRSPEARAARGRRGLGAAKALGKVAAMPWTVPAKVAGLVGKGVGALYKAMKSEPGEPAPAAPAKVAPTKVAPVEPAPTEPASVEPGAVRMGGEHPEDAVQVKIDDPTQYAKVLDQLKDHPKVSYAVGDGENVWVVSEDPGIKGALAQMASEAAATEGYQSWRRPVMRVRAALESGVSAEFGSVEEAEAHARDLHDLGYKGIILEELNITRTGMAVEVVFDNKQQASAAKGALLQYKGIDTVKDAENGTLVVFTTDSDPEEARNRVTTILQNARVPMEGSFRIARWRVVEANPGGQSAIGQPVPGISRAYNGPDEMPTPMPTTGGAKGSSIEAEDKDEDKKCPHCGGAYQDDICINCKRIRRMPPKTEQAGAQDPESKRRFMQPFYAPDDAELPPGPEMDAVPGPGEPGFEEPDYSEEPGEAPEEVAAGALWRLDVPEDPMEMERLEDVLNQAKEAGMLASWTEVGAPEEELPSEVEPGAEGPPEAVDLEVTPEFTDNEPAPTAPPRIGEQAGDEFDVPPEEPPAVAGVEPGVAAVDELPLEEPVEEDGHYIAVEFAAETEQEERERFPDWISDTTADPETGEGGLMIAGWKPDEAGEEVPGEMGDEIPGEIPGETSEISPEISPESFRDSIPTRGSPADEVPVPEERILGEDVGHLRNIYRAARLAEGKKDEENRARFVEALVTHGHDRGITRARMARILREDEAGIQGIYPDLARRATTEREPAPSGDGAIELPPELARLREDHRAMVTDGDEAGARRVMSELRFEAEARGVNVRDVVNEAEGKYPVAVQHMNARGTYQGKPAVVRAFYRYEDGSVTADIAVGGRTEEVPAEEVGLAAGMGEKPAWAGSQEPGQVGAPAAGVGEVDVEEQGDDVDEVCRTPGRKIRSGDRGRGLGAGRGGGPIGVPPRK